MQKKIIFILSIVSITTFLVCSISNGQNSELALLQNGNNGIPPEPEPIRGVNLFSEDIGTFIQDFQISDVISGEYLNNLITNIAKDSSFYDLIGFAIGMVLYGIFVFHFYRFLSKRDMFSMKLDQRLSQRKFKSSGETISVAPRVVGFIATNFLIFPFVIFLWFLGYSAIMFILVQGVSTATIFLASSSLIVAVRIAAYYNEDLSRDLAKLLPFALLAVFLYNPQLFSVEDVIKRLEEVPSFVIQIAAFTIVAMIVEIVLSILYLIKIKFVSKEKQ